MRAKGKERGLQRELRGTRCRMGHSYLL
jgi:hypothetical protein